MSLKIEIDVDKIVAELGETSGKLKSELTSGVQGLANMTRGKIIEMVDNQLHSSKEFYKDAISKVEEVAPGMWVISLDESANWIEEGISPGKDMKPNLLKHAKRVSKKGYRYNIIPFKHSGPPSRQTQYQKNLVGRIKIELQKRNIPWKTIEKDAQGNPRIGKLHSFDIESGKPTLRATEHALKGVSIYQTKEKTGNIRRDVLTFRTVSESPASAGKWIHPGFTAKKFMDQAMEWAETEWSNTILPTILNKY